MPEMKPIAKRLNKLFDEIQQEAPDSGSKARVKKNAPVESAIPATETKPTVRRARSSETVKTVTQTENILALAFQTSPNDWATLQVHDETGGRKWSEDDQALVQQVTDQLSLALENARLFQETQSRAEDLSVLNEMGNELSTRMDPKGIAEVIYKYTSRLMDTKNVYVALYNEDHDEKSYPLARQLRRHRLVLI